MPMKGCLYFVIESPVGDWISGQGVVHMAETSCFKSVLLRVNVCLLFKQAISNDDCTLIIFHFY